MRWQELVDRFRPVSAPGGAAESAEHVAERSGPALELAPVFALLDADLAAARRIAVDAASRAEALLDDARDSAAATISRARREAPAREAQAASVVLAEAARHDAEILDEARARTRAHLDAQAPRLDDAAQDVIARMLDTLKARP